MLHDININWRLVTSEVLQGFIPGLVLFNIFITDPGEEAESTLIQFMDEMPNQRDLAMCLRAGLPLKRALDRHEEWANGDCMKHSQDKG